MNKQDKTSLIKLNETRYNSAMADTFTFPTLLLSRYPVIDYCVVNSTKYSIGSVASMIPSQEIYPQIYTCSYSLLEGEVGWMSRRTNRLPVEHVELTTLKPTYERNSSNIPEHKNSSTSTTNQNITFSPTNKPSQTVIKVTEASVTVVAAGSPELNATAVPNIAEGSKHCLRPATIAVPIVTIAVLLTITIISYYVIRTRGRQVCLKILKLRRDNDNTCAHVHVALEPHSDPLSFPSEQTVASGHDHYSEIDDNGLYEDIRTTANSQEQDTTSLRETASTVTTTQQKAIYVIDPVCDE